MPPEDLFITVDDGAAIGASKKLFARVQPPTTARVEPLLGTDAFFAAIHTHLKDWASVAAQGDRLFIAGPMIDPELGLDPNDPSSKLLTLLSAVEATKKVDIRILVSGHPEKKLGDSGRDLKDLKPFTEKNIIAEKDTTQLKVGAIHNERIVVVVRGGQRMAYCGGPELIAERRNAWHVAVRLVGPAAAAMERLFRERWSNTSKKALASPAPVDEPPPADAQKVQLLRTLAVAAQDKNQFKFAPSGEFTGMAAIKKAVTRAASYVYIEDPSFTSLTLASWLGKNLAATPDLRVIVVVPKIPERIPPVYGYWKTRAIEVVRNLAGANQSNFAICHLEQPAGTALGCASRVLLVDDHWACVGSLGASRRSLTVNTELSVSIADVAKVKELRISLWKAHLGNGPGAEPDVTKVFSHWKAGAGRAVPHDPKGPEYKEGAYEKGLSWLAVADPLGWARFRLEDHLNPEPGALHPWVQANLELGARLLEAKQDGRLELQSKDEKQAIELAEKGSYQFRGSKPVCSLFTPEAIRLLDALLAANLTPAATPPLYFLSLLRSDGRVNHGRWLPRAKDPADVIKDKAGREVRMIGAAVDIGRFKGKDIALHRMDEKSRTMAAVEEILKILPWGLYDLGLPRPDPPEDPAKDLTLYFKASQTRWESPTRSLQGDIEHIQKEIHVLGKTLNPRESFKRGLEANALDAISWEAWEKLNDTEKREKVVICLLYPDADDHLHITTFRVDEHPRMKGKWKADNAIFSQE